jgi:excinuclease ABC subunit A
MGLNHLALGRKTRSLSAGEYQRLLVLKYLSFQGTDSLFVLDEPSLGLGEHEQEMLIRGLRQVIAQGNTVIVVDHSEQMQKASDHLVMMGPDSGHAGGEVLFQGPTKAWKFKAAEVLTTEKLKKPVVKSFIEVTGAMTHGHKWQDFSLPLDQLIWVHGPSGSGKTSCLVNVLAQKIHRDLHRENLVDEPGTAKTIKGTKGFKDVIVVDAKDNQIIFRNKS